MSNKSNSCSGSSQNLRYVRIWHHDPYYTPTRSFSSTTSTSTNDALSMRTTASNDSSSINNDSLNYHHASTSSVSPPSTSHSSLLLCPSAKPNDVAVDDNGTNKDSNQQQYEQQQQQEELQKLEDHLSGLSLMHFPGTKTVKIIPLVDGGKNETTNVSVAPPPVVPAEECVERGDGTAVDMVGVVDRDGDLSDTDTSKNVPPVLGPSPALLPPPPPYSSDVSVLLPSNASRPLVSHSNANNNNATATSDAIFYKTHLCRTFEQHGSCPYIHRCMFAHGANELRTVEQNESCGLTSEEAVLKWQRNAARRSARASNEKKAQRKEKWAKAGTAAGAAATETRGKN